MSAIAILIHVVFLLTIVIALVVAVFILGTKGMFLYGNKEGYVSIIVKGVENGTFSKAIGSMKGYQIDPVTTEITPDATARSPGWMGFSWIGIWPFYSAMVFDTEQTKIVNNDDGSVGLKLEKYPQTIYIPIQSTERLIVKGLELSDFASKVDFDVVITYTMTNVYTAKVKNRGSNKILKSRVEEGLREEAGGMSYENAIQRKNATTETASFKQLVDQLNAANFGYEPLSKETGYKLISINIVGVELSGGKADVMAEAYASIKKTEIDAKNTVTKAKAERTKREEEGAGAAKAAELMLDQDIRRLEKQKDLTPEQAMALAIEKGLAQTSAQVVNIGSSGGSPVMLNLEGKPNPKKKK
jgi:regulator of protease activity HflC (stomatin/prohibitin superfamily)